MQARSHGRPEWRPVLSRERDSGLCLLVHAWHVPTKLCDEGCITPGSRQGIGMRQLMCQRQGRVDACQGLRRVPQQPEGPSDMTVAANNPRSWAERRSMALVWRVACDAFLQVLASSLERAKVEPCLPEGIVGEVIEIGVVGALRQALQGFPELPCRVQL